MTKKKILYVVHDFPPYKMAGIQRQTSQIAKIINASNDVQIDILHPLFREGHKDYVIRQSQYEGLNTYILHKPLDVVWSVDKIVNAKVGNAFLDFLKNNQYDLIHFHSFGQLSAVVAKLSQEMNIPSFFTIRDFWFICYHWFLITPDLQVCDGPSLNKCAKCLLTGLKHSDVHIEYIKNMLKLRFGELSQIFVEFNKVFAVSEYMKKKFNLYFNKEITVNMNGIELINQDNFIKKKRIDNKITFGYIGNIAHNKGLHLLISAFVRINNPDIILKIYGCIKDENYYETLKRMMSNDNRIHFYGEYKPDELPVILSDIDMNIFPTLMESFGIVVIESFNHRVPVIAANTGGIPEIVDNGVNGLLFENNNANDLYDKIEYILSNTHLIDEMSSRCKVPQTLEEDATWHKKQYLDYLN